MCRTIAASAGADHPQLPEAVTALLTNIGVYRCDYQNLSQLLSAALARTIAERPELAAPLEIVVDGAGRLRRGGCPAAAAVRRDDGQGRRGLLLLP